MIVIVLLTLFVASIATWQWRKYLTLWYRCEDEIRWLRFRLDIFSNKEGRFEATIEKLKNQLDDVTGNDLEDWGDEDEGLGNRRSVHREDWGSGPNSGRSGIAQPL